MIFTIREYRTGTVIVDYADGSWAEVPLHDIENSKPAIAERIAEFGPKENPSWISSAAIEAGTAVDTTGADYQAETAPQALVTWQEARKQQYPSLGDQADALYWARHGDTSHQEAIDAEIAQVKTNFPKTWEARTRSEYVAYVESLDSE